jgi:hypothetical protein
MAIVREAVQRITKDGTVIEGTQCFITQANETTPRLAEGIVADL